MKKKTKTGTPRQRAPGAGRPPKDPGDRTAAYPVRLTPAEADFARRAGGGSLSRGVREIVRRAVGKKPS